MAKRLWLLFAQIVTVILAVIFVVSTLRPSLLNSIPFSASINTTGVNNTPNDSTNLNPGSYHDAVKRSMPAVVNVFSSRNANGATEPPQTESTPKGKQKKGNKQKKQPQPNTQEEWFNFFFGDPNQQPPSDEPEFNTGSGVLVNKDGIILTNHHVINGADTIEVAFGDGRKTKAKIIGSDPDTDIAVLKVDLSNLPEPVALGDVDTVKVGDVVLAIGNPFGVGQTVTSGIVSALGRDHLGINTFENFIQTDAAINPGNSGGALVDTHGKLIGINTAIFSKTGGSIGIGFAIPINLAKQVMESILSNGAVTRGWIGVEPRDISPEVIQAFKLPKNSKGVLISGVLKGGPAEKGGIKSGDVLKEINGKTIEDVRGLLNNVASLSPGSEAKLLIERGSESLTINVQIGKRPQQEQKK